MGKYASVIGIFLIGIIVVITGVYLFLTGGSDPAAFQMASGVTLVGLLVTGIGAIKGRRTMRSVGYFAAYPSESHARQVSQSRDRFLQSGHAQQVMDQAETHHVEQGNMTPGSGDQASAQTSSAASATSAPGERPTPMRPATQLSRSSPVTGATGSGGTPKIVKVIVCPGCGTENQDTDSFCSGCGKKIRPKASKSRSTKAASKKKIKATKKVTKTNTGTRKK